MCINNRTVTSRFIRSKKVNIDINPDYPKSGFRIKLSKIAISGILKFEFLYVLNSKIRILPTAEK